MTHITLLPYIQRVVCTAAIFSFVWLSATSAVAQLIPVEARDLLDRIDSRAVATEPNSQFDGIGNTADVLWDPASVISELARLDHVDVGGPAVAPPNTLSEIRTSVGTKTVELSQSTGLVAIRDVRGYDGHDGSATSSGELWIELFPLLSALAVDPAQCDVSLRELRAVEQSVGQEAAPARKTEVRAQKLLIQRHFGGIPIVGDKMVVSVVSGMEVRKVLGRWRSLDLGRSALVTRMRAEEIVARGVERIVSESHNRQLWLAAALPVRVSTQYAVVQMADGTNALRLQGAIEIPALAPDGGHKWSRYTFDLD